MNRRTAIRKALGAGAAVAALPVLDKVVEANSRDLGACSVSACLPPVWTPPPPDTRTPEQVILEQDAEEVADVVRHLTRDIEPWNKRYAYSVYSRVFDATQAEMRKQGIPIDLRVIAGVGEVLVGSNGNLARRINQQLYFGY